MDLRLASSCLDAVGPIFHSTAHGSETCARRCIANASVLGSSRDWAVDLNHMRASADLTSNHYRKASIDLAGDAEKFHIYSTGVMISEYEEKGTDGCGGPQGPHLFASPMTT
jgi:hypothetical protein